MSVYKKKSDDVKYFDNEKEFLKYYEKNKESIDEETTRSLNLKFKINGHRIGRKSGNIILYPLNCKTDTTSQSEPQSDVENEVVSEMENLKNEVNILKTLVDNLMKCQNVTSPYGTGDRVTMNQSSNPKQSPYQKNIWSLN